MPIFRNQGIQWPINDADFFLKTVWVNDYCAAQVSNSSSCSILIHINNTKPKVISQNSSEAFCVCLLADTSVSTDLQMQINSLPAGGAVGARNIAVSPGTAVIKSALRSRKLLHQALQETLNENDIKVLSLFN